MVENMAIQWRGPVPPSNYTVGRDGNTVELIVDHCTVVMFEGAIRRFLRSRPASFAKQRRRTTSSPKRIAASSTACTTTSRPTSR
jgi:hypothetical protein